MPGSLSWVDLATPDPERAGAFYRELFGWDIVEQGEDAGGYCLCVLDGHPVAGLGPQPNPDAPPWWTSYVTVTDVEATAAAVARAGGQVVVEPVDASTYGRMTVFIDTVGAVLAAWQPKQHIGAGLRDDPGTLCWNELNVRDLDEASAFYQAVFDWSAKPIDADDDGFFEWVVNGRTAAGVTVMDDTWPEEIPSHWLVYFAVDDVDKAAARAVELGGAISVDPVDLPPGRLAVLTDPVGAVFAVLRRGATESEPNA